MNSPRNLLSAVDFLDSYDEVRESAQEGEYKFVCASLPELSPMEGRTQNVIHVSECINRICLDMGHYEDNGPPNSIRLEFGSTWEAALISRFRNRFPDRFYTPREHSRDGIYGNPDLVDNGEPRKPFQGNNGPLAVHEFKLTWMSTKHGPDSVKLWKYWCQLMAYCNIERCKVGVLHIGYVNGDYTYNSDSGEPQYHVWTRRFSPLELAKNWGLIKITARKIAVGRGWNTELTVPRMSRVE